MPSKWELNLMYLNKTAINVTAVANGASEFTGDYYWSSTEVSEWYVWLQHLGNGIQFYNGKLNTSPMRSVRAF